MSVEQDQLSVILRATLARHWGYDTFRPMQEDVMRSVLGGTDTLALMPTGGGKSLCFQVPALASGKVCLVVSPLIALMKDQVERLRSKGIAARAITSDMRREEIENTLESAALGKLSFLYVSPERLGAEAFLGRLLRMPLGLIAVDEAHCISQWGYDFRPAYRKIQEVRTIVPKVPVLALTASATASVAADIMQQLGFARPHVVRGDFRRPELVLWVSRGEDKQGRLLRIMENVPGSGIVYMRERRGTVRIAQFLRQHGTTAEAYHAGLSSKERDRIQHAWAAGSVRYVVATNAFGMGIDKADVRCVVHMEPPPDLESYYQEAGRGGRDGRTAHAFMLVGPGDEEKSMERVKIGFPAIPDVRRSYQAFADMNGIALGSGLLQSYPLDLRAIAERVRLPIGTVAHSFKAMELDGLLALSDGARSPSRVLLIADQRTVYDMRVNSEVHGPLLEALLRLYGGLFEEACTIDEARVARVIGRTVEDVSKRLTELDSMRMLAYRPSSDLPSATLLVPRADADRLTLDPTALRDREQRAMQRLDALLRFVRSSDTCRMVMLLSYFDETGTTTCGVCDVCMSQKRYDSGAGTSIVEEPLAKYHRDVEAERAMRDEGGSIGPRRSK